MLPLVVALNVAGTVAIEDRTEVRGRIVNSPRVGADQRPRVDENGAALTNDNKSAIVMDVETDPAVRLRAAHKEDSFTLAYAPRIVVANFGNAGAAQGGETTLDLIHRPLLTGELQISPRTRFVLNSLVQFGSTTAGTLLLPERWDGQDRPAIPRAFPVLPFAKQTFLSIYAAAGLSHQFTPKLTGTVSAFFITFGQPTQAGRIASPGSTYLQNPGVNLELEYKARPTDTFIFNAAPQLNIIQASPIETTADGENIGIDGRPLFVPNAETTGLPFDTVATGAAPRYVNRNYPNTWQVLLEARYRKQVRRLTSYELALGANILQTSIPQTAIRTFEYVDINGNRGGVPASVADDARRNGLAEGRLEQGEQVVADPFGLLARSPAQRRPADNRFNLLPVGEALINHAFAASNAQGRLIAFSRVDAWLNTISGEIAARSATVAALNLDFGLDSVRAQAAFVQSLPLTQNTTFFRQVITELAYERELTKSWFFDIGARLGYQNAQVFGDFSSKFLQPGAFAAVSWRPLPAKL